ncbi:MAG TPA: alpha-hydroxy acid oxidase, partial [Planctomycetota bacterium]|nr:alpha-hydroxy acid oxidase [Planctomycetota bacterium]
LSPMRKSPLRVCLADFEEAARQKLTLSAYDFVAGGAADEITIRWNREAYDRMRLRPRVLVDVSKLDTRVKLLGLELPHPILLAPGAYQRLLHGEGELATARGASSTESVFVVSSNATVSIEDIARVARSPLWLQLYAQSDPGRNREIIGRAQAAGCKALVVTVDTPVIGPRNREERGGFTLPKGISLPMNPQNQKERKTKSHQRVSLTWRDIEEFRSRSQIPVLLKGILDPDDADQAVRRGLDGIIVSNHGGRNLDTATATIDALPAVVDKVGGRVPILIDGGIRRGTDIVKALSQGAAAVLIGRPYMFGLAVAGAQGVADVVRILRRELEMALALIGRARIGDLDRSVLG